MKIIERPILSIQEDTFFSPVRDKIDYIRLITLSARHLLLNIPDDGTATCRLRLLVDKMSRLFFYKDQKYFSVSFPLLVSVTDDGEINALTTYTGSKFDSKAISGVISVLNDPGFETDTSFVNFFLNQDHSDMSDIHLLEELYQSEPSYVRYDCDPTNVSGNIHPLHHLDVNYSQYGTFKLGLSAEIDNAYFENLQNIRTDCIFLKD